MESCLHWEVCWSSIRVSISSPLLRSCAANLVERSARQEDGPFEPGLCQEDAAAHHFGRVKQQATGSMTLKRALLATQRLHLLHQRPPGEVLATWVWLSVFFQVSDMTCLWEAVFLGQHLRRFTDGSTTQFPAADGPRILPNAKTGLCKMVDVCSKNFEHCFT